MTIVPYLISLSPLFPANTCFLLYIAGDLLIMWLHHGGCRLVSKLNLILLSKNGKKEVSRGGQNLDNGCVFSVVLKHQGNKTVERL